MYICTSKVSTCVVEVSLKESGQSTRFALLVHTEYLVFFKNIKLTYTNYYYRLFYSSNTFLSSKIQSHPLVSQTHFNIARTQYT